MCIIVFGVCFFSSSSSHLAGYLCNNRGALGGVADAVDFHRSFVRPEHSKRKMNYHIEKRKNNIE